jgi:membrane protein DedA with SNARE-associated domain
VILAAAHLIADAGTNATAAGPLTLIVPVGVLIVVIALWWFVWRRRRPRT